ncbi:MAG TPA: hypothetical protein VFL94_08910 [Actinomycetales bacterium]|nr:hypothetical protein [Actinomycetales bacterium]
MARTPRTRLTPLGRALLGGTAVVLALGLVTTVVVVSLRGDGPPAPAACRATVDGTTVQLSPEQMGNAATIAGIAGRRGLPARAATIGIATAMQESKLVNVSYGDRDSLGLFQQRPSQGWGTKKQVTDPVYATNAFYDVLVKVEGYRSLPITTAAQRVQRSAFPQAYAQHEEEARVLASALSGYSTAALTCTLDATRAPAGARGLHALRTALQHEQARTAQAPLPKRAGLRLTPATSGADSAAVRRDAWSVAQWAVGQAERLGIARVYVDGQVWRRASPDDGWSAARGAGVPTSGSRDVVVMLEDADPA